jgi:hypothetical protein
MDGAFQTETLPIEAVFEQGTNVLAAAWEVMDLVEGMGRN